MSKLNVAVDRHTKNTGPRSPLAF